MPTLLLIRHGENDVMHRRLTGRMPEVHLNKRGCEQAEQLAEMLKDAPIKAIYSSPLERAVETADPLARRLGLPVQIAPGLIEVNYGDWQGRTYKQLRRLRLWKQLQQSPGSIRFPRGESLVEVQQRALQEIESHFDEANDVVAFFAHADIVRLVMAHYLNMRIDDYQRLVIHPASVSIVQITEENTRVLAVNQVHTLSWPREKPEYEKKKSGRGQKDA